MGRDGLLGAFEEMVLLAVARGRGEAYGMTVRREIHERTGRDVTIGSVYATLERLEAKRWIASRWEGGDEPRRGRARRRFHIEAAGVEALSRAREMRDGLWDGVDLTQFPPNKRFYNFLEVKSGNRPNTGYVPAYSAEEAALHEEGRRWVSPQ